MKLGNWDEYAANRFKLPETYLWSKQRYAEIEKARGEMRVKFPHVVTVRGYYPEHDDATHWAWLTFGSPEGKCADIQTDRPICPTVLAFGEMYQCEACDEGELYFRVTDPMGVPEHDHEGCWTTYWISKTGYDYGFGDFSFQIAEHAERFRAWVQTQKTSGSDEGM